jgi:hypothetical protein
VITVIIGMCNSDTAIITVLKSVTRKRLVKTEDFMCAAVTAVIGVCNSETVIITVLKSVTRKRLPKTEKTVYVLQLQ